MGNRAALTAVLSLVCAGWALQGQAETLRVDYSDGPPSPVNNDIGAIANWTQPSEVITFSDPSFPFASAFFVTGGSYAITLGLYGQTFSGALDEVAFDATDFFLITPSFVFQGSPPPFSFDGPSKLVFAPGVYQTPYGETWTITAVPEPSAWLVMLLGLGVLGTLARTRPGGDRGPAPPLYEVSFVIPDVARSA